MWTPRGVAIYLATLAPFVLLFVGAAVGWTIAPLEHLSPTPGNVAAGAATFVVGLMIVRSRWGIRHFMLRSSVVVPEFEPPDRIRPAEADVLLHGKPRRRDVTATVIDLALRGFLRIDERGIGQGRPTWVFEQTDASRRDLREYELKTLAGLFTHGPTVSLAALETRFFVVADLVEEELEREVVRRGWFADPPRRLRSQWATAGWITALAGIPLTFLFGNAFGLGLAGAAVSAIGVLVYAPLKVTRLRCARPASNTSSAPPSRSDSASRNGNGYPRTTCRTRSGSDSWSSGFTALALLTGRATLRDQHPPGFRSEQDLQGWSASSTLRERDRQQRVLVRVPHSSDWVRFAIGSVAALDDGIGATRSLRSFVPITRTGVPWGMSVSAVAPADRG